MAREVSVSRSRCKPKGAPGGGHSAGPEGGSRGLHPCRSPEHPVTSQERVYPGAPRASVPAMFPALCPDLCPFPPPVAEHRVATRTREPLVPRGSAPPPLVHRNIGSLVRHQALPARSVVLLVHPERRFPPALPRQRSRPQPSPARREAGRARVTRLGNGGIYKQETQNALFLRTRK